MKIKERELLKKLFDAINLLDYRQGLDPLTCEIEELLAQPEVKQEPNQEIKVGIYDDIFSDYEYLVTAFKNGANAYDYSSDISRAFSDIRRARNWICPLPKNVIDEIALKSFYAGTIDFRVFARAIEKAHGIGFADE